MFKIKKIRLAIIFLIVITIAISAIFFAYSIYGYTVAEDYAYAVKDSLVNNVTNLPPYYRLDNRFQNEISEEEFYNAKTIDEFLSLFEKINSIDYSLNFFQKMSVNSTDKGKKEASQIIEDSNGKKYFVYHHIEVASSLLFEPIIVNWTIDITEVK